MAVTKSFEIMESEDAEERIISNIMVDLEDFDIAVLEDNEKLTKYRVEIAITEI